jgi:hypothetical protein
MARTFSLLGMVVFTVGVIALSSLARRTHTAPLSSLDNPEPRKFSPPARRMLPAFAYEAPFSLN